MKDKIVKTRKEHECACCNKTIRTGAKAVYYSGRWPIYDYDTEKQVSIDYCSGYKHLDANCRLYAYERKLCKRGLHDFVDDYEADGYSGCHEVGHFVGTVCARCGKTEPG